MSFEGTNHFFGQAMDVRQNIEAMLVTVNRSICVKSPLELDYGTIWVFKGYRV